MATPTTIGKLGKQTLGENLNTWGLSAPGLNGNADLLDDAIWGFEAMSLTGNKTLTSTNYVATNEIAPRQHRLTDGGLSGAPTITIPATANWWIVANTTTYVVTYSNGANSATVPANRTAVISTDGTNVYSLPVFTSADQSTYAGGYLYSFSTTTTDADPGSGVLRLDNATPSSATGIYIDDAEANGTDISALMLTWDDSTSPVRGQIKIQSVGTPSTFHIWQIDSLTDNSGYMDFTVTYVDGAGSFANNDEVIVSFSRTGDYGATTGLEYAFSTTTTDSDLGSGSGVLRLDNATASSATGIYVDDNEVNGTDVSALLATWDDSTSTVKGYITVVSKGTPATFHVYSISALTDNAGYMDFTVTWIAGNGSFSNASRVFLLFSRTGDKGDTGATGAAGTVSAAGDGTSADVGIGWASDADSGFIRTGSGVTAIIANGAEMVSIGDAAGSRYIQSGQAKYTALGNIGVDQSFDGSNERDISLTATANFNIDFEAPTSGHVYAHVLWITQDGTGSREITIRDSANTEATWLGDEPVWSGLSAGALTIVSVFYAPSGTLYAAEVPQ